MPQGKRADGARQNPGVAASRQSAANCDRNSNGGFLPKAATLKAAKARPARQDRRNLSFVSTSARHLPQCSLLWFRLFQSHSFDDAVKMMFAGAGITLSFSLMNCAILFFCLASLRCITTDWLLFHKRSLSVPAVTSWK